MKKIVCLVLAIMMMASVAMMASAAQVDYTTGTRVEYVGEGTEEYTVTVPALLAPGEAGDVVASGTWQSNHKLTVTADANVVLTNSINAQDTKTLAVTFAGIDLVGNNNEEVEDTKSVSVAAITDALFGTWSGKFEYDVELVDVE